MIEHAGPVLQTILGTLFTWGLTAFGAGLVFVFSSGQVRNDKTVQCRLEDRP